jgi:hypothetical protein
MKIIIISFISFILLLNVVLWYMSDELNNINKSFIIINIGLIETNIYMNEMNKKITRYYNTKNTKRLY